MELLRVVGARLLRHAVEEEARLMRVIMWEFKGKSEESISIMRYHREILAFVRYRLAKLPELPEKVALREIQIFLNDIRKHHAEEEKVVFPLALKAERLHRKKMKSVGR